MRILNIMGMKKSYGFVLSILLCFCLMVGVCAALADEPVWTQSSADGFGTSENTHIHALTVFKSNLYTGTMNGKGAQVLRTSDGKEWSMVVGTDLPGTNGPGFGDINNKEVHEIVVFKSKLYAVTYNTKNGTEVWRTDNGKKWEKVVGASFSGTNAPGFGNRQNIDIQSMVIFKSHLYAGTWNSGGVEIWRTADGDTWQKVNQSGFGDKANEITLSMAVFGDHIYAGTQKYPKPSEVWRSADGTTWAQASTGGFGNANNTGVECMTVFNSELYAGTGNYYGAEIFKTGDGQSWTKVIGNGLEGINNAGFGDGNNRGIWALCVFEDHLYAGVYNDVTGAEIWKTKQGADWTKVVGTGLADASSPGFGDLNNIAVDSFGSFDGYLYAATDATIYDGSQTYDKSKTGIEVWRIKGEAKKEIKKPPVKKKVEKAKKASREGKKADSGNNYLLIIGLGVLFLLVVIVVVLVGIVVRKRNR